MIHFPAIWWLFPATSMLLLVFSLFLTRSGIREKALLQKVFVALGALLGFVALALPFFEQPVFYVPIINYGLGIPLAVIGLVGRIYPMVYLQRQGTTTAMDSVAKLVDSGPYAWVRHPQYTAGLVMLLGWFLAWGAWYALGWLPLIAGMIYAQARIEEKYILERLFGEAYAAYRERVGMLLPRLAEKDAVRITTGFLGGLRRTDCHAARHFRDFTRQPCPTRLDVQCHWSTLPGRCGLACLLSGSDVDSQPACHRGGRRVGRFGDCRLGARLYRAQARRACFGGVALLALLVGGGFVPVFIGLVAAVARRPGTLPARLPRLAFLAALWPWPLVLMALWLPGSWLLGHFFGPAMLSVGGLLFLVFDIGLPVLAAGVSLLPSHLKSMLVTASLWMGARLVNFSWGRKGGVSWGYFLGILSILHAFVHLLYAGQALRFFELRPGLACRMVPGSSRG
jgi:protein-S-isoprenylcysteine O-methyltransferase Ste14